MSHLVVALQAGLDIDITRTNIPAQTITVSIHFILFLICVGNPHGSPNIRPHLSLHSCEQGPRTSRPSLRLHGACLRLLSDLSEPGHQACSCPQLHAEEQGGAGVRIRRQARPSAVELGDFSRRPVTSTRHILHQPPTSTPKCLRMLAKADQRRREAASVSPQSPMVLPPRAVSRLVPDQQGQAFRQIQPGQQSLTF
jgi:hypothetical protein